MGWERFAVSEAKPTPDSKSLSLVKRVGEFEGKCEEIVSTGEVDAEGGSSLMSTGEKCHA